MRQTIARIIIVATMGAILGGTCIAMPLLLPDGWIMPAVMIPMMLFCWAVQESDW